MRRPLRTEVAAAAALPAPRLLLHWHICQRAPGRRRRGRRGRRGVEGKDGSGELLLKRPTFRPRLKALVLPVRNTEAWRNLPVASCCRPVTTVTALRFLASPRLKLVGTWTDTADGGERSSRVWCGYNHSKHAGSGVITPARVTVDGLSPVSCGGRRMFGCVSVGVGVVGVAEPSLVYNQLFNSIR